MRTPSPPAGRRSLAWACGPGVRLDERLREQAGEEARGESQGRRKGSASAATSDTCPGGGSSASEQGARREREDRATPSRQAAPLYILLRPLATLARTCAADSGHPGERKRRRGRERARESAIGSLLLRTLAIELLKQIVSSARRQRRWRESEWCDVAISDSARRAGGEGFEARSLTLSPSRGARPGPGFAWLARQVRSPAHAAFCPRASTLTDACPPSQSTSRRRVHSRRPPPTTPTPASSLRRASPPSTRSPSRAASRSKTSPSASGLGAS